MSAIALIPARYGSTRFPGKPLYNISGKPMIQHVWEKVMMADSIKDVFVASDDQRIMDVVRRFGGKAIETPLDCKSGTDRIAAALKNLQNYGYKICEEDVLINVQGDEPLIDPSMIDSVAMIMNDKRADIGTLVKRIDKDDEIKNPNIVKAVFDLEGFALYFSRSPIPFDRDLFEKIEKEEGIQKENHKRAPVFKHIGIYAYRRDILFRVASLEPSALEEAEKLEQLRAMENGIKIKVRETTIETIGVDTPMDAERVEKCLNISS